MWKWLEQYFTFTRSDKNGIVTLVVLIVLVLIAPSAYFCFKPVQHIDSSRYENEIIDYAARVSKPATEIAQPGIDSATRKTELKKSENTPVAMLDINAADSSAFEKLNGIGPVLAKRIIKFRSVLGGFVSREQLKEVYGLSPETYVAIKNQLVVKKGVEMININTDDYRVLSKHPYLRSSAKAIVAYHKSKGDFKAVSDLKQIEGIADSTYLKIEPYLTVK